MRYVVAILCLGFLMSWTSTSAAQSLEENYKKKCEKEFLTKANWFRSFDKAKAESAKTGKPIFAYLTRSFAK